MNRIVVERQPLLLLVSSTSLLPVVLPARDVRSLPDRLGAVVASRLRRFGIEPETIAAELEAMHPVIIAPTVNRSVLGIMVDFAKAVPHYSGDLRTDLGLVGLEDWLAQTPCHAALTDDRVVSRTARPRICFGPHGRLTSRCTRRAVPGWCRIETENAARG